MPKQVTLKFLILGDGGVGKTSLINRFVQGEFIDSATMTIGMDVFTKSFLIDAMNCQLMIYDISGQERFRFMVENYMKGAHGALLLFDITLMTSFVNIGKWMSLVNKYYESLPVILIASKYDLKEFSMVGDLLAKKTQKKYKMVDYVKTSSKNNMNVLEAFDKLTHYVLDLL